MKSETGTTLTVTNNYGARLQPAYFILILMQTCEAHVAQASKPAVSPTSKSAGCRRRGVSGFGNPRYSRLGSLRYADKLARGMKYAGQAEVSAINNAGIQGFLSASSAGVVLVDPAWIPVIHMANSSVLSWTSVSGMIYQVWSTTNLAMPFTALGNVITAYGLTTSCTNNPTNSARYYRVQLLP